MNDEQGGTVAKVITIIGASPDSFAKAADNAVRKAQESIRNIKGISVVSMSATVDDNPGGIREYRTTVNIAFELEDS
jgi:dodecin